MALHLQPRYREARQVHGSGFRALHGDGFGGGILPLIQSTLAGAAGGKIAADVVVTAELAAKSTSAFMWSYIVPVLALAYMFVYSAFLSKPPKNIDELVK